MEVFEASGFAFLSEFVSEHFVVQIGRLEPRMREAYLTKRMYRLTSEHRFFQFMERVYSSHPKLQQRWGPVARAIDAHGKRDFYLSITALLPQVEGVFTDLLIARSEVAMYRGKPHAKNAATGRLILNRQNKHIKLDGLQSKIQRCDPTDDPVLQGVVENFLKRATKDRNPILHGNRPKYYSMKMSTQLAWVLYALGYALAVELHKDALRGLAPNAIPSTLAERIGNPILLKRL